jgi:hypothetical protein
MHYILEQYIYNIILDLVLPEMGFESKWVLRSVLSPVFPYGVKLRPSR